MGILTRFLQEQFRIHSPLDWEYEPEVRLLAPSLEAVLGYAPRADVRMTNKSTGQRLWIEFEVSRADPVANHAKFATGHLFQPQSPGDVFVSMVSRHVNRGRRNLAANTILLLRRVGLHAVQTVLFPDFAGPAVKRLNHLESKALHSEGIDVRPELERVFMVTSPIGSAGGHRIYFAGETGDVLLNAMRWNNEVATPDGRKLWGSRTVQYFVYVPYASLFAPSKFCAYLPVSVPGALDDLGSKDDSAWLMTMKIYVSLDESETRFDGHVARKHLVRQLGMTERIPSESPEIAAQFECWLKTVSDLIKVHSRGAVFLVPRTG